MRAPWFQAFCAAKTLAASKRQPVYYKIVLQTDQFERKKMLFSLADQRNFPAGTSDDKKVIRLKQLDEKH